MFIQIKFVEITEEDQEILLSVNRRAFYEVLAEKSFEMVSEGRSLRIIEQWLNFKIEKVLTELSNQHFAESILMLGRRMLLSPPKVKKGESTDKALEMLYLCEEMCDKSEFPKGKGLEKVKVKIN